MRMKRLAATAAFLSIVALPVLARSADHGTMTQGQGMQGQGMQGQGMQGQGMQGTHGMMTMGTRIYQGRIGPWNGEVGMMDIRANMKAAGMTPPAGMTTTHHVSVALTDPQTKKRITEGKGTVTVIGPDKSMTTTDLMGMQGHFGADVKLPAPGKYRIKVSLEAGGKVGTEDITYEYK